MRAIAKRTFVHMAEKKHKNLTETFQVFINTPAVFGPYFNMSQGLLGNQRVGERIRAFSLKVGVTYVNDPQATTRVRYLLVQTGTATQVDAIPIENYFKLLLPGQHYPLDTPFRYKILMDKVISANPNNGSDQNVGMFKFTKSWGPDGLKAEWAGSGTQPKYNNVWLFVIADLGTVLASHYPTVYSRLTFVDA